MRVGSRSLALALAWVLAAATAQAGDDPLLAFFPTAKDVSGLRPMGEARHCGGGEELTLLYDGGYQRYVQAGVIAASQRFFRLGGATVDLTVHQMKSESAAEAFLSSLCKDIKASVRDLPLKQAKGRLCMGAGQDSAYGYLATGPLLALVALDRADLEATRAILRAVAERNAGTPHR